MRTLEDLHIKVTYTVKLSDLEVSDEVFNELLQLYYQNDSIDGFDDTRHPKAIQWLNKNIEEQDAYELNYEIELINEEE